MCTAGAVFPEAHPAHASTQHASDRTLSLLLESSMGRHHARITPPFRAREWLEKLYVCRVPLLKLGAMMWLVMAATASLALPRPGEEANITETSPRLFEDWYCENIGFCELPPGWECHNLSEQREVYRFVVLPDLYDV